MKIRLVNFLCYEDTTYDFGEDGMVLLSGPSGSGKSSVCRGIFFALYGEGTKVNMYGKTSCKVELWFRDFHVVRTKRPNRLVLNGTQEDDEAQSLLDDLFGGMFRSTGYIQQNNLTSFILFSPSDKLAFLEKWLFSDAQMSLIRNKTYTNLKQRTQELSEVQVELDKSRSVLEELPEPQAESFPISHPSLKKRTADKADFYKTDTCAKIIRNEAVKLKNTQVRIRKLEQQLSSDTQRRVSSTETLRTVEQKLQLYNSIQDELKEREEERRLLSYDPLLLEDYTRKLAFISSQRDRQLKQRNLQNLEEELAIQQESELKSVQDTISKLKASLWSEISKDEIQTTIAELESALADRESISSLNRSLQDGEEISKEQALQLQDELEALQRRFQKAQLREETSNIKLECPECSSRLCLHKKSESYVLIKDADVLEDLHDTGDSMRDVELPAVLKSKIDQLQSRVNSGRLLHKTNSKIRKKISEIEDKYEELPSLTDLKLDLEQTRAYNQTQKEAEKKLKELLAQQKEENMSNSTRRLYTQIERLRVELKLTKTNTENENESESDHDIDTCTNDLQIMSISDLEEESMRNFCVEQKQNKIYIEKLDRKLSLLKARTDEVESEILEVLADLTSDSLVDSKISQEKISIYMESIQRQIDELTVSIEKTNLSLSEQKELEKQHADALNRVEQWKLKAASILQRKKWVERCSDLEIKLKQKQEQFTAAQELKDLVLEAESLYLIDTLESISGHAQVYLDLFFPDAPIYVRLNTFKETKKKEVKPQIHVEVEYKGMETDLTFLSGGELSRVVLAYTIALGEIFNAPLLLLDECTASLDQDLSGVVFESLKEHLGSKLVVVIAHQTIKGVFDRCLETHS